MKVKRRNAVTLITDASYCHETGVYGWAFYTTYKHDRINIFRSGAGLECKSSTQAEVIAIQRGLEYLLGRSDIFWKRQFTLMCDCQDALSQVDRKIILNAGASNVHLRHIPAHRTPKEIRHHECFRLHAWCDSQSRKRMRDLRAEKHEYLVLRQQAREIENRLSLDPRDPDYPSDEELIRLHFLHDQMDEVI